MAIPDNPDIYTHHLIHPELSIIITCLPVPMAQTQPHTSTKPYRKFMLAHINFTAQYLRAPYYTRYMYY